MSCVITNPDTIALFMREKQALEAELARDLYRVFNQPPALTKLQDTVWAGVKQMADGDPAPIEKAVATESIFALEAWGNPHLTAAYYMLPLATIVHNFHHALLEVALALTLNRVMDYHVGYYTTLWPKGADSPAELSHIRNVLSRVENDDRNRRFLLYYPPGGSHPAGCIWFQGADALRARWMFNSMGLLRRALYLREYPTEDDVTRLMAGMN